MDKRVYTVRSTDTLWGIARDRLGDPNRYKDIQRWNNLTGLVVRPGQVLILYNSKEKGENNG